jgi:hypothetical protein
MPVVSREGGVVEQRADDLLGGAVEHSPAARDWLQDVAVQGQHGDTERARSSN